MRRSALAPREMSAVVARFAAGSGAARWSPRVRRATLQAPWFKALVLLLGLVPLASLVWRAVAVELGPNPQQTLIWTTGLWALRFLLFALAITPLRELTGLAELVRFRRMLGLFAFGYAALHLTCYLWLVNDFSLAATMKDVIKHPFVLAGMSAFALMVPLAATSTNAMVKRLGAARWRALQRLVYIVAVLAVFHFWWFKHAKNDTAEPKLYALLFGVLLSYRVVGAWRARRARRAPRRDG